MSNLEEPTNVVAFMLLVARLGDIGSTYLATPTLKLESNPIVRRLKWPFALLTVAAAGIPYFSLPSGIIVLVASLLVCASNFSKLWLMRALGEEEYYGLIVRLAGKASVVESTLFIVASALCMAAIGWLLLFFYPDPSRDWGCYFGFGFFGYAAVIGIWGLTSFVRLRRESNASS